MYAYLDRNLCELDDDDVFLLSAMRGLVAAASSGRCITSALGGGFHMRGVADALIDFATAMLVIGQDGLGRFSLAPVRCGRVTDDEARLLTLFALARRNDLPRLAIVAAGMVEEHAVPRLIAAVRTVGAALVAD